MIVYFTLYKSKAFIALIALSNANKTIQKKISINKEINDWYERVKDSYFVDILPYQI